MERNKHQSRVSLRESPLREFGFQRRLRVSPQSSQTHWLEGPFAPSAREQVEGSLRNGQSSPDPRCINLAPHPGLRGPTHPHHPHHPHHLLRLARHPAPSQSKKKKMNGHHLPKKSQGQRPKRLRPLMMIMMSVLPRRTLRNSKPKRRKRLSTRKRRPSLSIARRSKS